MQTYLCVTPPEVRDAGRYTRALVHVAYRVGLDSTLLRREMLLSARGGLLSISDRDAPGIARPEQLSAAVSRECARRGCGGVVLDFEEPPRDDRRAFVRTLCASLGREVFVPEGYAGVEGAAVLVNTAVSGGSFSQHLQESMGRYGRVALDLQRLRMDFPLPSPSGEGRALTGEEFQALLDAQAPSVFYSEALCARYFTYVLGGETHFVLFDDAATLLRKLRLGAALGCRAAFLMYPEVSDLLEPLFGRGK